MHFLYVRRKIDRQRHDRGRDVSIIPEMDLTSSSCVGSRGNDLPNEQA